MKFANSFIPFVVLTTLLFVACGDDTSSTNASAFPDEVADKTELNTYDCDMSHIGKKVFVTDLEKNYECDGDEWFESYDQPKSSAKGKSSSSSSVKSSSSSKGKSSSSSGKSSSSSVLKQSSSSVKSCSDVDLSVIEGSLTDERDGKKYLIAKIGNQWWMTENLKYSGCFCYNNFDSHCSLYGGLYLWNVAKTACPEGWRLPTKAEFDTLINTVGGINVAGTNLRTYFRVKPAGLRHGNGEFGGEDIDAFYWSSTEEKSSDAWVLSIQEGHGEAIFQSLYKHTAVSVRCVMNDSLLQGSSSSVRPKSSSSKTNVSSSSSSRSLTYVDFGLTSPKETYFNPEIKYDSIIDTRDGKVYRTITIAPEGTDYSKTWMAENLDFDVGQGGSGENKYNWSWCFHYEEKNCEVAGRLYTWTATIDSVKLATDAKNPLDCGFVKKCGFTGAVQGICPSGWHLPDTTEWNALFSAVGGRATAAKILKTQTGWYNNGSGSDAFGFSALPAGYTRVIDEVFSYSTHGVFFWTSTEVYIHDAYYIRLNYDSDEAKLGYIRKDDAYSVRCIKDKE